MMREWNSKPITASGTNLLMISIMLSCLCAVVLFFSASTLSAQSASPTPTQDVPASQMTVEQTLDRIRILFGQNEFTQVLVECQRLEQMDPGNKRADYFKSRAEAKLREMGMLTGIPADRTPAATSAIPAFPVPPGATAAPVFPPPGATPAATVAPAFPPSTPTAAPGSVLPPEPFSARTPEVQESPVPISPSATPGVSAAASLLPEQTPGATPMQPSRINPFDATPVTSEATPGASVGVTAPAEPEVPAQPESEVTRTPYQSPRSDNFMIILLAAAGALIVIVVIVFIIIKKKNATPSKMKSAALKPVADAAPPRRPAPMPAPGAPAPLEFDDFQMPAAPDLPLPGKPLMPSLDAPPVIPQAPDLPGIPDFPPVSGKKNVSGDVVFPKATVVPQIPDIPTPSSSGEVIPDLPGLEEEDLRDIPSPTQYPSDVARTKSGSAPVPADLPTFNMPGDDIPEILEEKPMADVNNDGAPTPFDPPLGDLSAGGGDIFSLDSAPSPAISEPQPVSESADVPSGLSLPDDIFATQEPSFPAAEPIVFESGPSVSSGFSIENTLGVTPAEPSAPSAKSPEQSPSSTGTAVDLDSFFFGKTPDEASETQFAGSNADDEAGKHSTGTFETVMFNGDTSAETMNAAAPDFPDVSPPPGAISLDATVLNGTQDEEGRVPESDEGKLEELPAGPPESSEDKEIQEKVIDMEHSEVAADADSETSSPDNAFIKVNLDTLSDVSGEDDGMQGKPPSAGKIVKRNEALFQTQYRKGRDAFDKQDWKKAVHYLTIAAAIKPEVKEIKDMLAEARKNRRVKE